MHRQMRFIRRLLRDVNKRGRSTSRSGTIFNDCKNYMINLWSLKRYADIIIPEGAHNDVAIDLLTTKIRVL